MRRGEGCRIRAEERSLFSYKGAPRGLLNVLSKGIVNALNSCANFWFLPIIFSRNKTTMKDCKSCLSKRSTRVRGTRGSAVKDFGCVEGSVVPIGYPQRTHGRL